MKKQNNIVRYSADQIKAKIARGHDKTDWSKAMAISERELEASIAADPDDVHETIDWSKAIIGLPPPKDHINIRIDHDVLEWFKSRGKGYQTLMNNVLRAFVQSRQMIPSAPRKR